MENTDDLIMVADQNGAPVAYNDAYREEARRVLNVEMRPGLKLNTLGDDENRKWWDRIHQRALSGERFRIENEISGPEGSSRVMEMIYTPIRRAGRVEGFTEITRDITDLKRTEGELRRKEQLLRSVVDQTPVPILISDPVGTVIGINPATREELGLDDSVGPGIPLQDAVEGWRAIDNDDRQVDMTRLPIVRALQGMETHNEELRIRRQDGSLRDVVVSAVPVLGSDGELLAACSVFPDVTEIKRNQVELQRAIAEREVLIREVHHRVKNNLSIIIALQNLQLNRITDDLSRKLFLESVTRIHVMASIHEKLYSCDEIGPVAVGPYFRDLLQYILSAYHLTPEMREVYTEFDDLQMDANALVPCGLIVNELTTNTIKYASSPERKCRIRLSIVRAGSDHAELRYADDGNGIPRSVDLNAPVTLGLQLITSLSTQLGGEPVFTNGTGMGFRLVFPLRGASANSRGQTADATSSATPASATGASPK